MKKHKSSFPQRSTGIPPPCEKNAGSLPYAAGYKPIYRRCPSSSGKRAKINPKL